jgi:hypothetical protein
MLISPVRLLALIEDMDARKAEGLPLSRKPLVIEALRLYARMHTGEPAKYKVERWDWKGLASTARECGGFGRAKQNAAGRADRLL